MLSFQQRKHQSTAALLAQSGHGFVHRWTDRRTDDLKPVYPPFNFVEAGGIMMNMFLFKFLESLIINIKIAKGIIQNCNMTVWILAGNYISFIIAAGLIRLHMPGVIYNAKFATKKASKYCCITGPLWREAAWPADVLHRVPAKW